MAEGKGGDPEASAGAGGAARGADGPSLAFRVFLGFMAALGAVAAVFGAAYAASAFRAARDERDAAASEGQAAGGGTCSGFQSLIFYILLGTGALELKAYDPAGGPADPDFIHYNVTLKVGSNVAPSTIFRVEDGDRNYQEAMTAAGMLDKYLQGYLKDGKVYNPDSIGDNMSPEEFNTATQSATVVLMRYEAGATTMFPAQFEALAKGAAEGEYVMSLRTYRKSDPSHFQPHRAAHGVNGHDAAYDEARPHFHAWPLSEKVSVAQEGDYPKAGEMVRVENWGMEVYGAVMMTCYLGSGTRC